MIRVRDYEHADHYVLENLIKSHAQEFKQKVPDNQQILQSISYFTSFPQSGKIVMITSENKCIGYAIILYIWQTHNAQIISFIDQLFIKKTFKKFKPEIHLIEYLVKQGKTKGIEINPHNIRTTSFRVFKYLGFKNQKKPNLIKILEE